MNNRNDPAGNPGNERTPTPNAWPYLAAVIIAILSVLVVALVGSNHQHIVQLETELSLVRAALNDQSSAIAHNLTTWKKEEHAYKLNIDKVLRNHGKSLSDLSRLVADHQSQIFRLSNGTSNADVLDRLKETRTDVQTRLEREHAEVFSLVDQTRRDVAQQLEINKALLSETEQHVAASLNQTLSYTQAAVGKASAEMYAAQANVTVALAHMTTTVQAKVYDVADKVTRAGGTIHEEVQRVQQEISQSITIMHNQLSAEDDFVLIQLAGTCVLQTVVVLNANLNGISAGAFMVSTGTFMVMTWLISLWQFTSHLRHYNKPNVQRRIMAVLWMAPIYSLTSWLSLVWPWLEPFVAACRDCYEAYAIYMFVGMIITIFERDRAFNGEYLTF
jgi:hypothetical protein